ncbi:MAG: hypothetical protein JW915_10550 [Chitinispirillaceae bacterium]|nr:hypothetical protein [Chitinispirillaceae bacterium]
MFGAANSFFSALALAGLIYTIWQQHEQLKIQRTELELTREELKRSAAAQEETGEALQGQLKLEMRVAQLAALNNEIERCDNSLGKMVEQKHTVQEREAVEKVREKALSYRAQLLLELGLDLS